MGRIKDGILLWAALLTAAGLENTSHALPYFFARIDYIFAAAAILVMADRRYTAFVYIIAASFARDFLVMPFPGIYLLSNTAGLVFVAVLCGNLYKENYVTKVFILFAGGAAAWGAHILCVFVFYWNLTPEFITPVFLQRILFTTAAGAALMKISEFNPRKAGLWLRMTFGKK